HQQQQQEQQQQQQREQQQQPQEQQEQEQQQQQDQQHHHHQQQKQRQQQQQDQDQQQQRQQQQQQLDEAWARAEAMEQLLEQERAAARALAAETARSSALLNVLGQERGRPTALFQQLEAARSALAAQPSPEGQGEFLGEAQATLKAKLAAARCLNDNLQQNLESERGRITTLSEQLDSANSSLAMQPSLVAQSQLLADVQTQLAGAISQGEQLQRNLGQESSHAETLSQELQVTVAASARFAIHSQRLDDAQSKLAAAMIQSEGLKLQLEEARHSSQVLEEQVSEATAAATTQRSPAVQSSLLAQVQEHLATALSQQEELKLSLAQWRSHSQSRGQQLALRVGEQADSAAHGQLLAEAESKLAAAIHQSQELQKSLDDERSRSKQLERQLEVVGAALKAQPALCEQGELLSETRGKLEDTASKVDECRASLQAERMKVGALEKQLETMEAASASVAAQSRAASQANASLEAALAEQDAVRKSLNHEQGRSTALFQQLEAAKGALATQPSPEAQSEFLAEAQSKLAAACCLNDNLQQNLESERGLIASFSQQLDSASAGLAMQPSLTAQSQLLADVQAQLASAIAQGEQLHRSLGQESIQAQILNQELQMTLALALESEAPAIPEEAQSQLLREVQAHLAAALSQGEELSHCLAGLKGFGSSSGSFKGSSGSLATEPTGPTSAGGCPAQGAGDAEQQRQQEEEEEEEEQQPPQQQPQQPQQQQPQHQQDAEPVKSGSRLREALAPASEKVVEAIFLPPSYPTVLANGSEEGLPAAMVETIAVGCGVKARLLRAPKLRTDEPVDLSPEAVISDAPTLTETGSFELEGSADSRLLSAARRHLRRPVLSSPGSEEGGQDSGVHPTDEKSTTPQSSPEFCSWSLTAQTSAQELQHSSDFATKGGVTFHL
ncbi:unnamed protein product, partial [Polarella glacialis]